MSARADMEKVERFREAIEAGNYDKLPEHERDEALQVHITMGLMMVPQHTMRSIVKTLEDEYTLKQATAYRRIAMAKEIVGDLTRSNREVDKHLLYQRTEEIYQKAMTDKAYDIALQAIAQMVKIKGLDREDMSPVDPSKLEASIYELRLAGAVGKLVKSFAAKGYIDLDTIPEAHIIPPAQLAE